MDKYKEYERQGVFAACFILAGVFIVVGTMITVI